MESNALHVRLSGDRETVAINATPKNWSTCDVGYMLRLHAELIEAFDTKSIMMGIGGIDVVIWRGYLGEAPTPESAAYAVQKFVAEFPLEDPDWTFPAKYSWSDEIE